MPRSVPAALLGLAALLSLSPLSAASDQPAPYCQAGQSPAFGSGFALLKLQLGATMGDPLECEHASPDTGDVLQRTSAGLAYYHPSSNTPIFTDGLDHWALTPDGLVNWTGSAAYPPGTPAEAVGPSPSPTSAPPASSTPTPTPTLPPAPSVAQPPAPSPTPSPEVGVRLTVTSPAFAAGGPLPQTYTCYNALEPSPPIGWAAGPPTTRAYALIMDAPERPGGVLVQWLVYNLPSQVTALAENTPKLGQLPNGGLQGVNDLGKIGYSAPCPPPNTTYTYRFSVYALDRPLPLGPGAGQADVLQAAAGHVVAQGELTATYLRPSWPWG